MTKQDKIALHEDQIQLTTLQCELKALGSFQRSVMQTLDRLTEREGLLLREINVIQTKWGEYFQKQKEKP